MSDAPTKNEARRKFWGDVEGLLSKQYNYSDTQVQRAIAQYKQEVVPRLGEVVYNQGEEQTAKVIDGIIRNGLPWPSKKAHVQPP